MWNHYDMDYRIVSYSDDKNNRKIKNNEKLRQKQSKKLTVSLFILYSSTSYQQIKYFS